MDYSWVLNAMTGFTHVHLPLVNDYLWVVITHTTGFTSEYSVLLTSTKVHDRSYSLVLPTHQQSLMSSVLLMSHEPNTQVIFKFSQGMKYYSCFFVNLDVNCTVGECWYLNLDNTICQFHPCVQDTSLIYLMREYSQWFIP